MRISLNGTNVQASTNSQSRINKSIEMDSVSKSINNQIANAQKQLQELSENKDMSMEEKMKKRQEIQQQITDLNIQLKQHQMEQRKEQQKPKDRSIYSKKEVSKEKKQTMGLSQSSMKAMICADSALSLAKAQGNVVTKMEGTGVQGVINGLFQIGIDFHELFPLLLFVGIGAMIDFGPVLSNPKLMIFGAAAQFGIFFTLFMATLFGFELKDAASIAIIGAADGPTAIFVAKQLASNYIAPIMVAAYSYMALVPLVQPPIIKLCTTKKERRIKMAYEGRNVTKRTKILFPIVVTMIVAMIAPDAVALIGFLMFGNLIRECGVLNSLSDTAQNVLANLITLFLGVTIAARMHYTEFLKFQTLLIMGLGLVAFVVDTFGGIMIAKIMNIFLPEGKKINPMIGAAGISAFPMSARVVHKMGLEEDNQNFLLMHSIGVNVSGQVASVIAGGLILALVSGLV